MMIDATAILAEVKTNHARLDGCKVHAFDPSEHVPGKRLTCLLCGGEMQLVRIGDYIKGYEAAGGSCDDIWPGYRAKRKETSE